MLVADTHVGSVNDPDVRARLDEEESMTVTLDETERRRSRVRTTTDDDTSIGIVVGRELRDGDVLEADGTLVVVSLAEIPAMVIDFGGVTDGATGDGAGTAVLAALELGHAVGNRHWNLAVESSRAYLPVTDDRDRMAVEVDPHLPAGATVGYADVSPALFDDGSTTPEHDHSHGHADSGHEHAHKHHHAHYDHEHFIREISDPDKRGGEES